MKKKDIYDSRFKIVILNMHVPILRTRTWSKNGDHKELNFEGLEMQKWHIPTDRAQRVDEKMCHLTSYHVQSQSDGH